MLPSNSLVNQKLGSYPDSLLYQNLAGARNEVILNELQHMSGQDIEVNSCESISRYHGLSLSLGSQQLHLNSNSAFLGHSQNNEGNATLFCNSKYVKVAQDLLDEIVSVHREFKRSAKLKGHNPVAQEGSSDMDVNTNRDSGDVSSSERHDLQNKLAKLSSMLGEVDGRYRLYCNQMQVLVSSLDIVAGRGSAFCYTSLAFRTISRQFRCLQNAIKKQIESSRKRLGEQDENGVVLSRLRYVDQEFKGTRQPAWRPQRGLPETAVSVLRAWLFEHFLHPYPKDSEKLVLARQTGLSRSQVANWFINARVRLWKPMIEEMYREEFWEEGKQPNSPQDNTTRYQEGANTDDSNCKSENKNSVSLALRFQKNGKNPTPSMSDVYYIDPVNNGSTYNDVHLLSDYVT